MCWYWKINKILSVLESIDSKLTPSSKIASKVNEGKTSDTQAGDINVESIDYSKYYLIQCPNCDNKEIVEKKEFKNPTVYKKFSAEIGGLMFPMKFSCNKCKKNFYTFIYYCSSLA